MNRSMGISILFISMVLNCAEKTTPSDFLGFTKGVEAMPFDFEQHSPVVNGKQLRTANDCKSCHETVYENWMKSRHRVSFTNRLYKESHSRENLVWCENCHAPLIKPDGVAENQEDRLLPNEGISCNVCHVRNGKILVSALPKSSEKNGTHQYTVDKRMASEEMCASCHQFEFPTHESISQGKNAKIEYSDLAMQDTIEEWRSGGFAKALSCQGCHLLKNTGNTHTFPGGHSLGVLSQSLRLEAQQWEDSYVGVKVYTVGIGHSFPTGDLFRTMRIRIFEDNRLIHEEIFKKTYANIPKHELTKNGPTKRIIEDSVIQPPLTDDFVSMREFFVRTNQSEDKRSSALIDIAKSPKIDNTTAKVIENSKSTGIIEKSTGISKKSTGIPSQEGDFKKNNLPKSRREKPNLTYEIYMDYLHGLNHVITSIPLEERMPLVRRGRLEFTDEN